MANPGSIRRREASMKPRLAESIFSCLLAISIAPKAHAIGTASEGEVSRWMQIRMPPFETDEHDAYLCAAFPIPEDMRSITHIKPYANQTDVHHMLVFGAFRS